jgi:hypothetical protein|tara:strand:+ start:4204 stop:4380 length:177 start_codon:yes stop_codon:yes gene_type:complete
MCKVKQSSKNNTPFGGLNFIFKTLKELKVAGFRDHKLSSLFATVLTHLVEMIIQDSTG